MVRIREYKESDVERLQTLANNKNISYYMPDEFPFPYTIEDAKWWISTGIKEGIVRVVEYNNEFVGSVGAHSKRTNNKKIAAIGYWIGVPYWGKGIATDAVNQLTELIFSTTNIEKLEAYIYDTNAASIKVIEKAGYKLDHINENVIHKDDKYYNDQIYIKYKSDSSTKT